MLRKVTHCTGRVSANTRYHQLRWGDRAMGTAISCTECSQVAGLIQKLVETPRSSKAPSLHAAVLCAAVFHSKILHMYTCIGETIVLSGSCNSDLRSDDDSANL